MKHLLVTEKLGCGGTAQNGLYLCRCQNNDEAHKAWVYKYYPDFDFEDEDNELPEEYETGDGAIFYWEGSVEIPVHHYDILKAYVPELETYAVQTPVKKFRLKSEAELRKHFEENGYTPRETPGGTIWLHPRGRDVTFITAMFQDCEQVLELVPSSDHDYDWETEPDGFKFLNEWLEEVDDAETC